MLGRARAQAQGTGSGRWEEASLVHFDEDVKENLRNNVSKKTYYEISERFLRSISGENLNNVNPVEVVARLRALSIALRYNKISNKLDENIFELLRDDKKHKMSGERKKE